MCMGQHCTKNCGGWIHFFLLALKIVIYGTLLTVQVVAAQNLVVARSELTERAKWTKCASLSRTKFKCQLARIAP